MKSATLIPGAFVLAILLASCAVMVALPFVYIFGILAFVLVLLIEWWRTETAIKKDAAEMTAVDSARTITIRHATRCIVNLTVGDARAMMKFMRPGSCLMCNREIMDTATVAIIATGVLVHPDCLRGLTVEVTP